MKYELVLYLERGGRDSYHGHFGGGFRVVERIAVLPWEEVEALKRALKGCDKIARVLERGGEVPGLDTYGTLAEFKEELERGLKGLSDEKALKAARTVIRALNRCMEEGGALYVRRRVEVD